MVGSLLRQVGSSRRGILGLKAGTPTAAAVQGADVIPKKLRLERAISTSTEIVIAPSIRIDQLSLLIFARRT